MKQEESACCYFLAAAEQQCDNYLDEFLPESVQEEVRDDDVVVSDSSVFRQGNEVNFFSACTSRAAATEEPDLPDEKLLGKQGYVLALTARDDDDKMKWRNMYWAQYGLHTVAWFASGSDFQEYMYNPVYGPEERAELVQMDVNFAQELHETDVHGYNATHLRKKSYGDKVVHQFALERFMGNESPNEAIFGSYHEWEITRLREAIVECMRNTPFYTQKKKLHLTIKE